MTLATQGKTVLFLTAPDDVLVRAFAVESRSYGLAFLSSSARSDWWIAWVSDGEGQVQAALGYLGGQSHFLGTDPQEAMRAAHRLINGVGQIGSGPRGSSCSSVNRQKEKSGKMPQLKSRGKDMELSSGTRMDDVSSRKGLAREIEELEAPEAQTEGVAKSANRKNPAKQPGTTGAE